MKFDPPDRDAFDATDTHVHRENVAAFLLSAAANPPTSEDAPVSRSTRSGAASGLVIGALLGGLSGMATCWLMGSPDYLSLSGMIGIGVGAVFGAVIGRIERRRQGEISRGDAASIIGCIFGLAPSVLVFILGGGGIHNRLTTYAMVGMTMFGPMAGLVIGGLFDRAAEAFRHRTRREAATSALIGLAACTLLGWFLATSPLHPDLALITRRTKSLMIEQWRLDPLTNDATIQDAKLIRERDGLYEGIVHATIDGRAKRFAVIVEVNGNELRASWNSIDE